LTAGIDLHIHTTASDGKFSPADIVRKAANLGLAVIAICDHDTVNGLEPALTEAASLPHLRVIPGIEVSTHAPGNEVHILGYFIDHTDTRLQDILASLRNSRRERARAMTGRLGSLGVNIDWQRVKQIAGSGSIGRPHIAQAMLEKGHISSIKEAFTYYIGQGGPAYVERHKINPVEAVALIKKVGGLPVLAHPTTINEPEVMVSHLKKAGLVGLEVYYKDYSKDERQRLARLAGKYGLIGTGGSDYHGLDDTAETLLGLADVPQKAAEALFTLAGQQALRPAGLQ
jgi:predicted metal-dependent phosphoesterase TrpH